MLTLPIPLLLTFLLGLLSLFFLLAGFYLIGKSWRRYRETELQHSSRVEYAYVQGAAGHSSTLAADRSTALGPDRVSLEPAVWRPLILGVALLTFTFFGRQLIQFAFPAGSDEPKELHSSVVRFISRPDGTKIRAEIFGPDGAPTLVLTHGWGTSEKEWYYAKRQLSDQFRLITWDLPGLGQSTEPTSRTYTLDKMAADLESVLSLADGKPVVLVGHSIGGMINLTYCRLFPEQLGKRVVGIAQLDTSYTNPVLTTKNAGLSRAIQKPIAEPLLQAMTWLSPVLRMLNWLSYQNGLLYVMNAQSSFGGSETRGQLDLISRYAFESSQAVVARGTLAMFHWDAEPVLRHVSVPVLVMVGKQDTTTLPSASSHMEQTIPEVRLMQVSNAAHYGLLEQNKQFNSAVARFALNCLQPK